MRILRIRGKNLASLAGDFEVDFETGPLSGDGLFTISGPTGAGKSTLLDAVCLALFNATPRNASEAGAVLIPDADDNIRSSDPRTVVRRGTAEGFAEVTFKGQDGRRYIARWSAARARGRAAGRFQQQQLTLHDVEADQPIGRTQTEVLAATQKRVGLSFAQFRRSALLAQGDFAAFLKADSKDRADLLERMTGTEIYGDLSKMAHERARQETLALDKLKDAAQGERPLDPDARRHLEESLEKAQALAAETKTRVEVLEANVLWWKRLAEFEESIIEAREQESMAALALIDATPVREELAQVLAVQPLRGLNDDVRRAATESKRARDETTKASETLEAAEAEHLRTTDTRKAAEQAKEAALERAQSQAPEIERAKQADAAVEGTTKALQAAWLKVQTLEAALSEATKEDTVLASEIQATRLGYGEAETWLAAHPLALALSGDWSRTETELNSYWTEQAEARRIDENLKIAIKAGVDAELRQKACKEALSTANAGIEVAKAVVVEAEAREATMPSEALNKRRETLARIRDDLAALERAQATATALNKQLQAKRAETQRANEDAARLDGEAVAAAEALKPIAASIQTTEELQRNAAAILSLGDHRKALRDGAPCPLCGSKDHPGIDPAAATEDLFRQKLRELLAEQRRLTKQETAAQTQAEGLRNRARQVGAEAEQVSEQLAREEEGWTLARQRLADESAPVAALEVDAAPAVSRLKNDNEVAFQRLAFDENEAAERKNAAVVARRALDEATSKASAALETLDESTRAATHANTQRVELNGQARTLEVALASRTRNLAHAFREHPTWQAEMAADSAAFTTRCRESVSVAIARQEEKAAAERVLRELEPRVAKIAERVDATGKLLNAARTEESERKKEGDAAKEARATLLGGRPVDEVQAELESNIKAVELALESARRVSTESGERLAAAKTRSETALAELAERIESHRVLTERRAEAIAAKSIDLAELQRRLAFDDVWIETQRRLLQALEDDYKAARTRLDERQRSLQAHTETNRPEGTREEAFEQQEPARVLLEEHRKMMNNSELLLRQDDEKRGRNLEAIERVKCQEDVVNLWASMSGLIGSHDGKRFRSFAQSLTLESLVEHANFHLQDLAPRYLLQRVPTQDVDLQIIDRDMGDEIRSVTSLSGGETFLVSLALALGLSSLASDRVRIESLFIDEGFGSLDQETLELALSTLDSLQADGRKVGLISHVQGLSERIGVQVRIEPMGAGRSRLRVIAA